MNERDRPARALIVTGPTASGKSALAMTLARRLQGTIINADAMQCYREFRVLTARPSIADEERIPHRLYGVRGITEPVTAAWWREAALGAISAARGEGRLPILCGGSGLYLTSLVEGLSPIPDVDPAVRAEARRLLGEIGPGALHARLARLDPETAARLRPSDSQRIARAWEVLRASGHGLAHWQNARGVRPNVRFSLILLLPERAALSEVIARRFAAMLEEGAVEEVRAVRTLDPTLPAMRAHGVPELLACISERMTLEEAKRHAVVATCRYAKRQMTWLRHHPLAGSDRTRMIRSSVPWREQSSEREIGELIAFIRETG